MRKTIDFQIHKRAFLKEFLSARVVHDGFLIGICGIAVEYCRNLKNFSFIYELFFWNAVLKIVGLCSFLFEFAVVDMGLRQGSKLYLIFINRKHFNTSNVI